MEKKTIVRATPAARLFARENNIDLSEVKGSGPKGRVHKSDLLDLGFTSSSGIKMSPLVKRIVEIEGLQLDGIVGSGPSGRIMKRDIIPLLDKETLSETTHRKQKQDGQVEVVEMTSMRRVIAKRMTESYLTAPTFIVNTDVDMTNMLAMKKQLEETIKAETGVKPTITDYLSLALVKALIQHPYLNSSLSEDGTKVYLHKYVNLAIAVGSDDGLLVPVVNSVDKMSLKELVVANRKMITKAVEGKLKPDEMSGSTFTVSNLGMYGVDSFQAIINQPNSAILAVSATKKKPVVIDDNIVVRPIMTLTLTADHRIVDGLEGAKFMKTLKANIENPVALLI
ncbi:MAG: dihydrolipoamide acetyltransferase [Clostridiales bacterium]|nr:MAG: dihydrolipoamide acetyltransferase [Clostridiales bacterium]